MASHDETRVSVSSDLLARLATTVERALEWLAAGDTAATAVLGAWREGMIDREAIMERTGLASNEYEAARARLTSLARAASGAPRDTAGRSLRVVDALYRTVGTPADDVDEAMVAEFVERLMERT